MERFLVVIDMQNDFIDGALGTKEAEAIPQKVAEKILSFDGEVILTQDTHGENYLETQEGKLLPVIHCIKGTPGWDISSDVMSAMIKKYPAKELDRRIIEKPGFGSFVVPEILRSMLTAKNGFFPGDGRGLEIEMVGLCTDICVVVNAIIFKTAFSEAKITVDASCCAGVTPEKHKAALETMRSCQINVINE